MSEVRMTDQCIFCGVAAGNVGASVVYQDEATIAFVDPRQSHTGHLLVIPRAHIETLDMLPEALAGPLMRTVVSMTRAVKACFQPDGISIWQSNSEGAGQEIPHVHFHVFPRWNGDDHLKIYPQWVEDTGVEELEKIAERIRPFVGA